MTLLLVVIILLFGLTVFRGAPYVPTHRRHVEKALDLMDLNKGDVVVDLGSGDGVFLRAAAERGLIVYGYEINPLLCLVAWLRCYSYQHQVTIKWRDFWLSNLPKDTKGVFVFSGGPFMKKLALKLESEASKRSEPFHLVSYGFELPGHAASVKTEGLNFYQL